jgi:hypothetical protein
MSALFSLGKRKRDTAEVFGGHGLCLRKKATLA